MSVQLLAKSIVKLTYKISFSLSRALNIFLLQ